MSKNRKYTRVCIMVMDIACVVVSLCLTFEIKQRNKEQYIENVTRAENQYIALLENLNQCNRSMEICFRDYEKIQENILEEKEKYKELEILYNTKLYIDDIAAEIYKNRTENAYIERYFMVEKKELQSIVKGEGTFETLSEAEEYGLFLPIGAKIWLRYEDLETSTLPIGIVIENPQMNIGYQEVKVGMDIDSIRKKVPEAKEMKTEIGDEEYNYLEFEDSSYFYYYFSAEETWGQPTTLYITKKQE